MGGSLLLWQSNRPDIFAEDQKVAFVQIGDFKGLLPEPDGCEFSRTLSLSGLVWRRGGAGERKARV